MTAFDWFPLAYGVVVVAYLGLFVWGERRSARYYDEMEASAEKLRAEHERAKSAG